MRTRKRTRRERYDIKKKNSKIYPISLCCINFRCDGNLGYLIRSAACFGADCIHVIGSIPHRSDLNSLSGSLFDYVKIKKHSSPSEFMDFAKSNGIKVVVAEICEGSIPISSYSFDFSSDLSLVVGQEESGVPPEILRNCDVVHIPMPGVGFCLNTSQTANILLYEAVNQFEISKRLTTENAVL